ncbi:rod shape-determining protein RodA [sulfur-oxidizing endosymbiont of Gigantopelta aegis]|uniref:rod shape-determining protein RodA n=1 Tax=sulfur-oxidizing endosymbiont of Gigantopelta aegis TaxID=2794934 RepID=UPI003CCE208B
MASRASQQGLFFRLHIDLTLLMSLIALIVLGQIILYSASGESIATMQRQGIRLGIAFVVMLAIAQVSPDTMRRWSPILFIIGAIMLIAVLLVGTKALGAQRWLNLGFFRFQPSEMMKLAVPMMLAWYLSSGHIPPRNRHLLVALVLLLLPVLLIAKQPDLGTSLLVSSAGLFVIFMAGVSWRLIAGFIFVGIAFTVPMWLFLMHDYQRQRVLTMLNPESDPLGSGYHIIQSKIAIGSGGSFGKGWLNGTQSHLEFLPERHTDFIFSVFAEEFGFSGVLLLLSLYLFIIFRGVYITTQAHGTFARLLGASIVLTFLIYVFVNIGMVSGILPVVGVPLPLVSYGGTSIVTLMAGFGILMSIHTHRKLLAH